MNFRFEDVREKRNAPRIRFRESVQFAIKEPNEFNGSSGCDISATGLRITVNHFIPLHTELSLMVELGPENYVECVARVVWINQVPFSEKYQIGLAFLNDESEVYCHRDVQKFVGASLN